MTKLPTVRQLQYFTALEEQRHFGKAADACFVSQSAFSNAIQELESTLGVQLVDRTNRRVTITAIGSDIAVQARLCLRDLEALTSMAQERGKPLSGKLTLGVIPTIGPFLLPGMLRKLRRRFPELQLYLREERSEELDQALLAGSLDLVLLALPYPMKNVETEVLFRDHFLLACRRDTKLVDPENYSINRLNAESVLLLEEGHCLRDHTVSACRLRNLEKVNRFAASSLHTLLEMVEGDLGVTFVPEMAQGSALLRGSRIATYPMPEASYREVALAWRMGSGHAEEFRQLGDFIRDHH